MKTFFMFLQWLGLRCSKCGSHESEVTVEKELRWGLNIGDLLLEDPYLATIRRRTCTSCHHVMSSTLIGTEGMADA